jgi:hypothetical protein
MRKLSAEACAFLNIGDHHHRGDACRAGRFD